MLNKLSLTSIVSAITVTFCSLPAKAFDIKGGYRFPDQRNTNVLQYAEPEMQVPILSGEASVDAYMTHGYILFDIGNVRFPDIGTDFDLQTYTVKNDLSNQTYKPVFRGFSQSLPLPIAIQEQNQNKIVFLTDTTVGWEGESGGWSQSYYRSFWGTSSAYHGLYEQSGKVSITPSLTGGGLIRSIKLHNSFVENALNSGNGSSLTLKSVDSNPLPGGNYKQQIDQYNEHKEPNQWLSTLAYDAKITSNEEVKNEHCQNDVCNIGTAGRQTPYGLLNFDIASAIEFLANPASFKGKPLTQIGTTYSNGAIEAFFNPIDPIINPITEQHQPIQIKLLAESMGLDYLTWSQQITGGKNVEFYQFEDESEEFGKYLIPKSAYDPTRFDASSEEVNKFNTELIEYWNKNLNKNPQKYLYPGIKTSWLGLFKEADFEEAIQLSPLDTPYQDPPLSPNFPSKITFPVVVVKNNGKAEYITIVSPPLGGADNLPFYHPINLISKDNNSTQMKFLDKPTLCATNASKDFQLRLVGVKDNQLVNLPLDIGVNWKVDFSNKSEDICSKKTGRITTSNFQQANYEPSDNEPHGIVTYFKLIHPSISAEEAVIIDIANGIGLDYIPPKDNNSGGGGDNNGGVSERVPEPTSVFSLLLFAILGGKLLHHRKLTAR